MAIFGFKKRKDEKLEHGAEAAKGAPPARSTFGSRGASGARDAAATGTKTVKKPGKAPAASRSVKAPRIAAAPTLASVGETHAASVIIRPRVTEKSGLLSQGGVYTFEVARDANKEAIGKAVKALYKVMPIKVAVINTPAKNVFVKGRRGTVAGFRKAIVTVKKGEKIDFV